jgi:hypothetical protein
VTELDELRAWKAEALEVMDGLQELGRALDLPLGTRITGREAAEVAARHRQALEDIVGLKGSSFRRAWIIALEALRPEGLAACPECEGRGRESVHPRRRCATCDGTGRFACG